MKCPECLHENPEAARFCNRCAHEFISPREKYSQALSFEDKINKIQRYLPQGLTAKILSQKEKIEGERKQVSVMFCDMVGFTPMVENLGPEKAYSIMDEVYEILIHNIHDFEGTVNEMTGDGIMALFGAPITLEDAPQRALRSAMSIHNDIRLFNAKRKTITPIRMRIGVHTGPVVVGTLGNDLRVEFKAVGDTVNLASRIEGLAEPGTTYVTEDTFRLTEALFHFKPRGEKAIKGKRSAVPVYKLLSAKKDVHRPRLGFERSIYSEIVGRDEELARLEFQVLKAIQGDGFIINIIGEAGIGKSRLVAELKTCDMMKKISLFEGSAISTGKNLSFYPVIDFLKQWARIGEGDNENVALGKLEMAVRRVDPEGVPEVLPFVATLMGMKLSGRYAERIKGVEGEALEKLIFKNMRDLLARASEKAPIIIVTEDLHWADTSSIELMVSLFRLAETRKIVFVNAFRPGYKKTGNGFIERIKRRYGARYIEIFLQPLDDRMSEILINNMLNIKGVKHAVVDQIIDRADGNPFFIEEVVRSFIDQGAIVIKNGVFEVTEKIDNMVIPLTINDVLMARIDGLEEKTRDLIKVASVIGRRFFYRILKEVTKSIDDIDDRLSYLKEIQLIREQKSLDELEYLFKHALAQEAAYDSVLIEMRKDLHLKVACSIENVFKKRLREFYGMLAYHYSKGENLDEAEKYMIKAGEEALCSSASHEALRYYKEALNLYLKKHGENADPEKLAMLEKNIALAFFNKGEFHDALGYFDCVLKRWGIKPPRNKILMWIKLLLDLLIVILNLYFPSKKSRIDPTSRDSEMFNLCHKKDVILALVDPMRAVAEGIGTIKKIFKFDLTKLENGYDSLLSGSSAFSYSGLSFKISKKFLDFVERIIDRNNSRELFDLKFVQLMHDFVSGKYEDIYEFNESLLDENLQVGLFLEVSSYTLFYGLVKIWRGDFNDVYPLLDKLSKIAEDYEYKIARQFELMLSLFLFLQRGNLNDARKSVEKWETTLKLGSDMNTMVFLGLKAQFQVLLKEFDEAEKSLNQVAEIYEKQAFVPPIIAGPFLWSRSSLDIKLLEESILYENPSGVSESRKIACRSCNALLKNMKKSAGDRSRTPKLLGRFHWLIGEQNMAVKFWKRAITESTRLGARPDLARTYMEIGTRFQEKKSKYKDLYGIPAKEYVDKARTMFKEMELECDLDELDEFVASL